MKVILKLVLMSIGLIAGGSFADPGERPYVGLRALTAESASSIAMAAYRECAGKGYHVAAAVVSREGRLLALVRSPLAGSHTIEVSQAKAYSAATFQTPTTELMGRERMRDIPGALLLGGGLPISVGGYFYGAVGVSGAPARERAGDVDDECAAAGIAAISDDLELAGD